MDLLACFFQFNGENYLTLICIFNIFSSNLKDCLVKVKKKAKIRNQNNQVPHLTRDTKWESHKNTSKHHTQESQEVSLFPAGDQKAARNIQHSIVKTNQKHK